MARSRSRALASRLRAVTARARGIGSTAVAADLVDAARSERVAAALAELERGADANTRSADGTTALHWAVYHDDVELVSGLIAAGADPTPPTTMARRRSARRPSSAIAAVDRAAARRGRRRRTRPARMGKRR